MTVYVSKKKPCQRCRLPRSKLFRVEVVGVGPVGLVQRDLCRYCKAELREWLDQQWERSGVAA